MFLRGLKPIDTERWQCQYLCVSVIVKHKLDFLLV